MWWRICDKPKVFALLSSTYNGLPIHGLFEGRSRCSDLAIDDIILLDKGVDNLLADQMLLEVVDDSRHFSDLSIDELVNDQNHQTDCPFTSGIAVELQFYLEIVELLLRC